MSKSNRPRLGRGLSSLMGMNDPASVDTEPTLSAGDVAAAGAGNEPAGVSQDAHEPRAPGLALIDLSVDEIFPNPHQPRREFNGASLAELAASLRTTGLVQPIIVRKGEKGYELIAGERRLRAAKLAEIRTLPAIVKEVDRFAQAQMALVENIQREDLNPVERALAYRVLMTELGLTQAELAGRMGEDRSTIGHYLRLLDLADPVREMVRSGKLSIGHAKLLAGVTDAGKQRELADRVLSQSLSVRNLERLVTEPPKPNVSPPAALPPTSAYLRDLERSLSSQLGMRVEVRTAAKAGKGKLIIHYATLDQFDDLKDRLRVTIE